MENYVNNSEDAKRIRLQFAENEHCHASWGDGECFWEKCPQIKEYLSFACPLWTECEEL